MKEDYGWASEHVSHIGYLEPDEPLVNLLPEILRVRAGRLLDVIEEFVEAIWRGSIAHMVPPCDSPSTREGLDCNMQM